MRNRKEIEDLVHRDRDRKVKSTRESGWNDPKNKEPIRRSLRASTATDRVCIFIIVFLISTILAGGGYIYMIMGGMRRRRTLAALESFEPVTAAQFAFVCLGGGLIGVIVYAVISLADPYGTAAAEKAEAKRQRDRDEFLKEVRNRRGSVETEHEQAIRRLAEQERLAAEQAATENEASENQQRKT